MNCFSIIFWGTIFLRFLPQILEIMVLLEKFSAQNQVRQATLIHTSSFKTSGTGTGFFLVGAGGGGVDVADVDGVVPALKDSVESC